MLFTLGHPPGLHSSLTVTFLSCIPPGRTSHSVSHTSRIRHRSVGASAFGALWGSGINSLKSQRGTGFARDARVGSAGLGAPPCPALCHAEDGVGVRRDDGWVGTLRGVLTSAGRRRGDLPCTHRDAGPSGGESTDGVGSAGYTGLYWRSSCLTHFTRSHPLASHSSLLVIPLPHVCGEQERQEERRQTGKEVRSTQGLEVWGTNKVDVGG